MIQVKSFLKSKTLWFNLAMFLIALPDIIGDTQLIPMKWLAVGTTIGNFILRSFGTPTNLVLPSTAKESEAGK